MIEMKRPAGRNEEEGEEGGVKGLRREPAVALPYFHSTEPRTMAKIRGLVS